MKPLGILGCLFWIASFHFPLTFHRDLHIYLSCLDYEYMFGKTILFMAFLTLSQVFLDAPGSSLLLSLVGGLIMIGNTFVFFFPKFPISPSSGLLLFFVGIFLVVLSSTALWWRKKSPQPLG